MKVLSTVLTALVSAVACAAAVSPTLPVTEWADCEAATNAALPSATWQKREHFDVVMSVAAGTNLLQLAFCFDPSWDTVRVVSAGPDDADGRVRVEIGPDGTLFIMR